MTQAIAANALAERDDITLLTPKIFTGKTLTWRGDHWEKSTNGNARHYSVKTRSIANIADAFDVLSTADNAILIHGRPLSTTPKVDALRRAENFADAPHRLIVLDLEGFATNSTDAETVGKQARELLPVEFHNAAFIMHLSSGFGMEPGIGRAHLFFVASRPVTRAELTAWLAPMRAHKQVGAPDKSILDECVWRRVQPVYLATPVFVGAPDPYPNSLDSYRRRARSPSSRDIRSRRERARRSKAGAAGASRRPCERTPYDRRRARLLERPEM